jgi:DcuC family C4-dicarboxylate transporter
MQLIALAIIALTVVLIVRRFQTHATLLLSGFALLTTAHVGGLLSGSPGPDDSLTGLFAFDLFAQVSEAFSSRVARIGMIIMAAGGFAKYMSEISASSALVNVTVKPLSRINDPYLLLAITYVLGQFLNIFIPSAAGLAMLLLVAMYPTLVRLGVRPVAAAAVIGTTACLDLGPASAASNVAAEVIGITPIEYFIRHQLEVTLFIVPVIAALHYFWQRWCDRREGDGAGADAAIETAAADSEAAKPPAAYALLPILPLVLLFVFSPLLVQSIQLDVVTAMLISLAAGMACEAFRLRSAREAMGGIMHFFRGMGDIFTTVVTLIVAAEIFATGVKATGLIESLVAMVEGSPAGSSLMTLAIVLLLGLTALLTGSGNAALFSFANMIPGIAGRILAPVESLMLPSQLAGGLFRSMSPVAGVIIAVAGAARVSPLQIVKRTSVPMIGGVVAMLAANALLN